MIRLAEPEIGSPEIAAVNDVLRTGMLVQGPHVAAFEQAVARHVGVGHAVAVSSGTAALHLALRALGIGPGDEVLVPGFTFPASANTVELVGAVPVLVDIDLATFNLDPRSLDRGLSRRTRAIMPVHLFGQPADMEAVLQFARDHGLKVVEDAACALGASYRGRPCGGWSDVGCFSFHPRKVITTGEGGMIATDDAEVADRARAMRNHGQPAGAAGHFAMTGFNYRMTDLQGAMGVAQMARLEALLARRRELAALYDRALADVDVGRPSCLPGGVGTWQAYVVMLPGGVDRDRVRRELAAAGIESTVGTYSLGLIPRFEAEAVVPRSNEAQVRSLALPLHPRLDDGDIGRVAEALAAAIGAGSAVR